MGPDVSLPGGTVCETGQAWTWDQVGFSVLHPRSTFWRLGNDSSCVLKVTTAAGSVLFTGDVEGAGERALLADAAALAADVVVVPHHGSATSSSPALVTATAPDYAVVSAAYLNHWGFPKPPVVERWREAGAQILTTGEAGAGPHNPLNPVNRFASRGGGACAADTGTPNTGEMEASEVAHALHWRRSLSPSGKIRCATAPACAGKKINPCRLYRAGGKPPGTTAPRRLA